MTERKKVDREKMAATLAAEMIAAGATAEIEPRDSRRVDVEVKAPGGAHVTVDFDGGSPQPDVHVCTWNTRGAVFLNPAIGDVNSCHFGKATRVCHGLDALVKALKRDVERFVDGSGYLGQDDPRIVEMRARYRERGWRWPTDKEGA